ncbi:MULTISPECIES: hypothetical protein [Halomonas]|uniref:hypothetical protein n=1 Tax=Halomonas TaxID=2745 RepID=UPI003CE7EA3E
MSDLSDIERTLEKQKADFFSGQERYSKSVKDDPDSAMRSLMEGIGKQSVQQPKNRKNPDAGKAHKQGNRVELRVRQHKLAPPEVFVYESSSLSKLDSELRARQAAKKAGWPVVTIMIDITPLS